MSLVKQRQSKFPETMVAYGSKRAKALKEAEIKKRGGRICELCNHQCVTLATDHDHRSKLVRGFICDGCNSGLGCFQDNFAVMERAVAYLRRAHDLNIEWWKITDPTFQSLDKPEDFAPSWIKRRAEITSRNDADQYFYD